MSICAPKPFGSKFLKGGYSYWPLWWYGQKSKLHDMSGHGVDLTPSGAYFDGQGYYFDGSDDYMLDTYGRKIIGGTTEGSWSSVYLTNGEVPAEGNCYSFNMNRCLYYEILREAGKPELGPILCEYDRILTESFSDWVILRRHETIASGDKHCTFRYCKK